MINYKSMFQEINDKYTALQKEYEKLCLEKIGDYNEFKEECIEQIAAVYEQE